jgi:hemoglobin-like flavoprotein
MAAGLGSHAKARIIQMNTPIVAATWFALGERQQAMVGTFYERFFQRHPRYREMFPAQLNEHHLNKMVETMSLIARLQRERPIIAPRIQQVGDHHRPYALDEADLGNFRDVFVEVLAEFCGADWNPGAEQAWREAFDEEVIPIMMRGSKR